MSRTIESMEELFRRVVAEDSRKHDVIADTRRMSVDVTLPQARDLSNTGAHEVVNLDAPDGPPVATLTLDGPDGLTEFELTDHALGQVSADTKIPKAYFDRMKVDAPGLFKTNVEHWFYQTPKNRMVRGYTNDGDALTGRAWMSDKFRRLDYIEIARTLLPEFDGLGTDVEFHQAAITDSRLYIRALFPKIERDIAKVGDTVRWGVEIKNSETGQGSLTISGFVLRLACINGLTTVKALNARHIGKREDEGILSNEALAADDVAFWLAARDTLRATCSEAAFNDVCERLLDAAASTQIVSPVAATKVLANEFALTEAEQEAVMIALVKGDDFGSDFSKWGALNAVTAVAKTAESFDRQADLEGIGWQIAQLPEAQWSKIALAVK